MQHRKITFIGAGNMARAIIAGLVAGGYPAAAISVCAPSAKNRDALAAEYGINSSADNITCAKQADVVVLAVKPQMMAQVCLPLQEQVDFSGKLVLSIAAGILVSRFYQMLGEGLNIVRIMPNTPSQVGLGIAGIYAPPHISLADQQQAEAIMRTTGEVVWLHDEQQIHSITGISGSGPAYVFYLLNALQQAAINQGFTEQHARHLRLNTFTRAVALAEQSGEPFSDLQQKVTSKGGTTHEAIQTFNTHQVAQAIQAGVEACVARSQAIAQQFETHHRP